MIKSSKAKFIMAMLIFASIGIFVKNIDLPSPIIVQWRTIIGSIFLFLLFIIRKKKIDIQGIKNNLIPLIIAGLVLGGGWAFLFEAYHHTSVGMATMAYYCAPIGVFILSPIIFREKVSSRQVIGMVAAILGMLVVNVLGTKGEVFSIGVVYGLIAALFYAILMITNKFVRGISPVESTWVPLIVAGIVMSTYVFFTTGKIIHLPHASELWLVLILGVVHTGIAYHLYFSAIHQLTGQSISILSYIDPGSALLFALVFLGERLSLYQLLGAVLIFGGTIFSQTGERV